MKRKNPQQLIDKMAKETMEPDVGWLDLTTRREFAKRCLSVFIKEVAEEYHADDDGGIAMAIRRLRKDSV